jgi:hypothetical protein
MLNGSPTTALASDDQTEDSDKQSRKVAARQHSLQCSQQGVTYTTSLKCDSAQVAFLYRAIYLEVCCQSITQDCLDWTVSPFLLFETCRLHRPMSEFEGEAENMCSH